MLHSKFIFTHHTVWFIFVAFIILPCFYLGTEH
jgi:hypothetical protein